MKIFQFGLQKVMFWALKLKSWDSRWELVAGCGRRKFLSENFFPSIQTKIRLFWNFLKKNFFRKNFKKVIFLPESMGKKFSAKKFFCPYPAPSSHREFHNFSFHAQKITFWSPNSKIFNFLAIKSNFGETIFRKIWYRKNMRRVVWYINLDNKSNFFHS